MRSIVSKARRLVVKVGSSLLTRGQDLDTGGIARWARDIAALRTAGVEVALVSSGAVASGMQRLGWSKRPSAMHELQAAAAVGQMGLVQAYESSFRGHDLHTAQVLLTHDDLSNRKRYLNARSTLLTLLGLKVIPIINENDTVATDEIRFGDNDTLAALVTNLIEADILVILTDQAGFYSADPRRDAGARLIEEAKADDAELDDMAGGAGSQLGRGGMATKLLAARRAARSGAHTVIAPGLEPEVLARLFRGERLGTLLIAEKAPIAARKQWLADQLQVSGTLTLDAGAVKMLSEQGKSLLSIGVSALTGEFERGEVVACLNTEGRVVARGLVNYNAAETRKILRRPSHEIEAILGYVDEPELIHRDNMVLL